MKSLEYVERIEPGQPEWTHCIGSHLNRYRFASKFVAGSRVLDAGCGVGYGTRVLLDGGASEIVAVDISEKAIGTAQKWFVHPRVRFVLDNCEQLGSIEGRFDTVMALESMEHFQDIKEFLKQVVRLLSPGGVFICSTPNALTTTAGKNGRPANPFHVKEYDAAGFRELLSRYFATIRITGQHPTAALHLGARVSVLWSNPFVRLGWLIQRMRGHQVPWTAPALIATEADYVISEANLESAEVLMAVCREPQGSTVD